MSLTAKAVSVQAQIKSMSAPPKGCPPPPSMRIIEPKNRQADETASRTSAYRMFPIIWDMSTYPFVCIRVWVMERSFSIT